MEREKTIAVTIPESIYDRLVELKDEHGLLFTETVILVFGEYFELEEITKQIEENIERIKAEKEAGYEKSLFDFPHFVDSRILKERFNMAEVEHIPDGGWGSKQLFKNWSKRKDPDNIAWQEYNVGNYSPIITTQKELKILTEWITPIEEMHDYFTLQGLNKNYAPKAIAE